MSYEHVDNNKWHLVFQRTAFDKGLPACICNISGKSRRLQQNVAAAAKGKFTRQLGVAHVRANQNAHPKSMAIEVAKSFSRPEPLCFTTIPKIT